MAWFAAIAIDFLLNAGVFASVFVSESSFLLPPAQAFLRIPAGYASLFFLILVLAGLIHRGEEARAFDGMRIGLLYGGATSLGLVLGLWSRTAASPSFLAVWSIDLILEMSAAGSVIASSRSRVSRRTVAVVAVVALASEARARVLIHAGRGIPALGQQGLVGGDDDLVGVHDDDVVTRVDVGSEVGAVLAAKKRRRGRRQASEDEVLGVDHEPVAVQLTNFW